MSELVDPTPGGPGDGADWQRRVVGRSLKTARQRSIDRGASLIRAASTLLERSQGDGFTVQDVADEAGQSLRTLYQYFESKDDLLLAVFEEAMILYAGLIGDAIRELDDALERLAGAIVAAAAMPSQFPSGVDVGLARLRLRLGQVQPDLVARSLQPVTDLFTGLVDEAIADGGVPKQDSAPVAFSVIALVTTSIVSHTVGNDVGLALPDPAGVAAFCLGGMGADASVVDGLEDRLSLPASAGRRPA